MSVTKGVLPPITTPMTASRDIDFDALRDHISRLERAGVHGIIPCGSTGERAMLSREEHEQVIETTVDEATTPVIAGTGASSTWEAVELTQHAEDVGADGALIIYPYYSWPENEHAVSHYETIADAVDIPIVIYNIPKRVARNMEPDSVVKLAEHPNIAGIKESSGDINQMFELFKRTADMDFDVVTGYDSQAFPTYFMGSTGVTSVAANVYPKLVCDLYEAGMSRDVERGIRLHNRVLDIESMMNLETIPISVKQALSILDHHEEHVRQPLCNASAETVETLEAFLSEHPPAE